MSWWKNESPILAPKEYWVAEWKERRTGKEISFFPASLSLSLLCFCLLHANHSCLEKSSRLMMMAIIHCDNGCSVNHVHTLFFVKENWFSQQNSMTTNLGGVESNFWDIFLRFDHRSKVLSQIRQKTFLIKASKYYWIDKWKPST